MSKTPSPASLEKMDGIFSKWFEENASWLTKLFSDEKLLILRRECALALDREREEGKDELLKEQEEFNEPQRSQKGSLQAWPSRMGGAGQEARDTKAPEDAVSRREERRSASEGKTMSNSRIADLQWRLEEAVGLLERVGSLRTKTQEATALSRDIKLNIEAVQMQQQWLRDVDAFLAANRKETK